MVRHLAGITAAVAVIILLTFLPFLPGGYDSFAVPVSSVFQVAGKLGLLLVPVGIIWLIAERRGTHRRKTFATVALAILWLVLALSSLAALPDSVIFAVLAVGALTYVITLLWKTTNESESRPALPIYLTAIPALVLLFQIALGKGIADWSRLRAIENSSAFIADIEQYRAANGRYPQAVVSVWRDYSPDVIGVRQYIYKQSDESYNVIFEHPSLQIGVREFVVYSPVDQQTMTTHALDALQLTPAALAIEHTRGHNEDHEVAGKPHWKYFWFD